MTMSWTGRRLNSLTNSGTTGSYLYNADGIRTRKTVGSTVTEYFTNGSTILAEKTGSNVIWYIYDSDGEILGFTYNGTPYYYIKNVQGDVYKVVNASGSVVASYTYDAWGKVLSAIGSMANINPIRYRSYYYGTETGFYYLQSRYYDPETGRFLNADGLLGANQDLLSYNLYAYCSNNPVNCSDPTGRVALECVILGIATAAFIGTGMILGAVGAQVASQQLQGKIHYTPSESKLSSLYHMHNSSAIQIAPSSAAAIRSEEKEQEKTAIDSLTSRSPFCGADIVGGTWKVVTGPMSYQEALVWIDTTAAAHIYGRNASWGLYSTNQSDALTMATILGFGKPPIFHAGEYGQFPHYHVGGYNLFGTYKHFHLWYGTTN